MSATNSGAQGATPDTTPSSRNVTSTTRTNHGRRRQQRIIATDTVSYQGECEDFGYIIALRPERFDKKIQYQTFLKKIRNYVTLNLKDRGDIYPLYTDLKDPTPIFQETHKPTKPETDVYDIDLEIYSEEVKQFVQRKMNMRRNLEKSYGLVWGQCSSG